MQSQTRFAAGLLTFTMLAGACLAQQPDSPKPPEGPKAFQLDFVIRELEDGKVVSSRNYSMMVSAVNNNGSIRAGDKVPVTTKTANGGSEMTYIDVGVNIDCRGVLENQGKLYLVVAADISSVAPDSNALRPVIRATKWSSGVDVPYRKPTVLFSSDDASSKRKLQLELTAAPLM